MIIVAWGLCALLALAVVVLWRKLVAQQRLFTAMMREERREVWRLTDELHKVRGGPL